MVTIHLAHIRHAWMKGAALAASAAFLGALLPLGTAGVARADGSLCVNPGGTAGCFVKIQDAVNAASAGATISVAPGTYAESVTIAKPIALQGADPETTIIDATNLPYGIAVHGVSWAAVSGFTVENANLEGINVQNSSSVQVHDNTVMNNDKSLTFTPQGPACPGAGIFESFDCGEGIYLQGVSYSSFTNNRVQGNSGGILVTDETGPTHDNLIRHNRVLYNLLDCGITMPSHPTVSFGPAGPVFGPAYGVYSNLVADNTVIGNGTVGQGAGIGIFGPTPGTAVYNNTISGNTVVGNGTGGVTFHAHTLGQNLNGNHVVGNTISGNGPDPDPKSPASGVIVFADPSGGAGPIVGTVISGNRISNETDGIWVGKNGTSLTANLNDLSGTINGVENVGSGTVDATLNYWGCKGGPGAPGCSGVAGSNVTVAPWLITPGGLHSAQP